MSARGSPATTAAEPIRLGGRACGFRVFDERGEGFRVVHGDVGEDLPVDLDARHLQTVDEDRIGDAVGPDGRVDAGDPQATELCLAIAAVTVGVVARVHDLFFGDPVA